jgi:KipI family sensor histidine kinase inhibitor
MTFDGVVTPSGEYGLLVEPPTPEGLAELRAALRRRTFSGVTDWVAGERNILLVLEKEGDRSIVHRELEAALTNREASRIDVETAVLDVPVVYDGADLPDVAGTLGLTPRQVIEQHTRIVWTCAFIGFAPGFGYLTSADGALAVPRRREPRPSVPSGAVALAGGYSAIYPRSSPGGWQIIGSTELQLWDVEANPPNLIGPGTRVRFVEAGNR